MPSERLRVFLAHTVLAPNPRGLGLYAVRLGEALSRRDDAETMFAAPISPGDGPRWVRVTRHRGERRILHEAFTRGRLAEREGAEVFHGLYSSVPLFTSLPRVSTVHDVIWRIFPGLHRRRIKMHESILVRLALHAERIILPSRRAAEDFLRSYSYPREQVRIIPEAQRSGQAPASSEAVAQVLGRLAIEPPYLLCLGASDAHKRVVDALRAVALLQGDGKRVNLVITGRPGEIGPRLEREARRLSVEPLVRFAGYVDVATLDALLTGATALVFPSLYEGFGLPPLEAMACGTPVIATGIEPMTEVLGQAALFVPARDPRAIARAAASLLESSNLREEYRARGFEQAARYSWDRTAAAHMEVYREVARR